MRAAVANAPAKAGRRKLRADFPLHPLLFTGSLYALLWVKVLYFRTARPLLLQVAPEGRHTFWGGLKPLMDSILFTAWPKPARVFVHWPAEGGLMELSEENRRGAAPNIGGRLTPASYRLAGIAASSGA
jgi:hypothetical protein